VTLTAQMARAFSRTREASPRAPAEPSQGTDS
jgi:hypothetical protein